MKISEKIANEEDEGERGFPWEKLRDEVINGDSDEWDMKMKEVN